MSVTLIPQELGFRRPFTQEVSQTLHLQNPGSDPIVFKVKTTAPKRYCVRPNSGRIEPGKSVEVQVLLQAMKEDPPLDAKCRDKFLVQSVAVSADKEFSNVSSIWQDVEQTSKSSIQERKIRVFFLPASAPTDTIPEPESPEAKPNGSPPPTYSSPEGVRGSFATESAPSAAQAPRYEASVSSFPDEKSASVNAANPTHFPSEVDELKYQLKEARAHIEKLKDQLAEQGLRQHKVPTDVGSKPPAQQQATLPTEAGVPLQIVATLCFLSFLMAYLFF